jgi:16S rRNA (cytidine1402-2'-O)-methyltransferase
MKGTLYIVSTPIGNLDDITLRALHVLKTVDVIAAEDTRHSLKLLSHFGISKPMISYWREKEKVRSEEIIKKLLSGKSVALISDAGTPGISDPGSVLIRKAIEENIPVLSIPGPSACIAALSLSGFPADEFTFLGFLPSKKLRRLNILKTLSMEKRTVVFFEAPHRIIETLTDMVMIMPGRKAALVKEITKMHEEVLRGTVSEILTEIEKTKIAGEYVLVLEGSSEDIKIPVEDALAEIHVLIQKGFRRKEAVSQVAETSGFSKKELYDQSLKEIP